MKSYSVRVSNCNGVALVPGSKSHTIRAILFATLAEGRSIINNFLDSPDTWAMVEACRQFGATIEIHGAQFIIDGVNGQLKCPDDVIDAGNSGQVLRFIGAVAGLIEHYVVLTGDASIRYQRPATPLLSGLEQLGCFAVSTKQDGKAPIIIKGPIQGGQVTIDGEDSQPVSGLIIASAFAKSAVEIIVNQPGETAWVNLTLFWLDRLGIPYQAKNYSYYKLFGNAQIKGFTYTVPADFSSAAFPLIGALITKSRIELSHLDLADAQGDKKIIELLIQLGAAIEVKAESVILDGKNSRILGAEIDVNPFIDALPILTVLACFAESETRLFGAKIARAKESDRIAAICTELRKMGAQLKEFEDGIRIYPSKLIGSRVSSHLDHRIAMSLAIAGMAASGDTIIEDTECVAKSFPNFVACFQNLGAHIEEI